MHSTDAATRKRRPHNELKLAIRDYLRTAEGRTASIPEIRAATSAVVGDAPQSSYRTSLQDERYFQRVTRGVFRLKDANASE